MAVADEPEHVRLRFLRRLYTYYFLNVFSSITFILAFITPDTAAHKTVNEYPILIFPAVVCHVLAVVAWARSRPPPLSSQRGRAGLSALSGVLLVAVYVTGHIYAGMMLGCILDIEVYLFENTGMVEAEAMLYSMVRLPYQVTLLPLPSALWMDTDGRACASCWPCGHLPPAPSLPSS